ncbi:MAG TPA: NAD-dependent epimerase/dehydratase family protein [Cyclobacteriaceae bacterium]|nr:NAD-dependent epimerase/dehydratase family protein [Cyclobacteriaceae bacterium]
MTVIITGVAGFIGSNLAKCLLENDIKVIGIDNFSFGNKRNISSFQDHPLFSFYERDLLNNKVYSDLKGDTLVHLASQKIPRYSSALKTLEDNSRMLSNAIQNCLGLNLHLVFASTSDIYGKNPNIPYHEESDILLGPTTVKRWSYALSKIHSEQLIQAYYQDKGLTYTIMRFFGSYGPNQNLTWWGGPQSVFIQNILEGKQLEVHGDGKQTRTFTYVDDTVNGIYRCITNPLAKNEIFNIAGNPSEEISISELAQLINELMTGDKSGVNIKFIPYETFGKYEDVRRRVPSIEKIKQTLGFNPTHNLIDGLKKTIQWQTNLS